MKKYWFKIFVGECPVCGTNMGYKVKQTTKKPKDRKKRYVFLGNCYCGCIN